MTHAIPKYRIRFNNILLYFHKKIICLNRITYNDYLYKVFQYIIMLIDYKRRTTQIDLLSTQNRLLK